MINREKMHQSLIKTLQRQQDFCENLSWSPVTTLQEVKINDEDITFYMRDSWDCSDWTLGWHCLTPYIIDTSIKRYENKNNVQLNLSGEKVYYDRVIDLYAAENKGSSRKLVNIHIDQYPFKISFPNDLNVRPMWDNDDIPDDYNQMQKDYFDSLGDCPVLNSYEEKSSKGNVFWVQARPTCNYKHIMQDIFCNGLNRYYFDI